MGNKAILFSDLHAHQWADFSTIVEHRKEAMNSRLADCVRVIAAVAKYAEAHNIRYGFFAGDLFHRKRLIDVPVFNAVSKELHRLARRLDKLFLLAGNHDLVRRSAAGSYSNEHALAALGRYRHIEVVDTPQTVLDGFVGMVPYADDLDTTLRGLEKVSHSAVWCILHVGIAGAHTGAIEYQPLEPLTAGALPHVPIFSGHYHRPQAIERKGPPVTYIGAPLEFVRGDGRSKRRGFIVVDLDDPKSFERVAFKGPRFVSMNSSDLQMSNDDVRGNFVDLLLDDPDKSAEDMTEMLMGHGARAVNTIPYQMMHEKKTRLTVKSSKGSLPTIADMCEAYMVQAPEELDMDILRAVAKEALSKAEIGGET